VLRHYGTWEFDALFTAAASDPGPLPTVAWLLVACVALKSAQFPFHSWLPDTMETPTPVSAFMHAGIINAGGFLLIRLQPLLVHAPSALHFLALLGALTAMFGAVVMLPQPSVKRALAYSTIAQMGFMLLQCGVGAFALALLHIVAHSLYKAHAFLRSGSTIGAPARAAVPLATPWLAVGGLGGALVVAAAVSLSSILVPSGSAHPVVFTVVLALAIAYGLARLGSAGVGTQRILFALLAAAGLASASLTLHAGAAGWIAPAAFPPTPVALQAVLIAMFAALFAFQVVLWRAGHTAFGRHLYVHALNGFYIGALASRTLNRLWPRQIPA